MTKELKLEECVNLLSASVSGGASSSGAYRHQKGHHHRHQNKPTSLLPPNSPYASTGNAAGSSPGHNENSTFAGQSLITSTPKAMIRRNSKNELRGAHQCTIRLLDDSEILQCEFQVKKISNEIVYKSFPHNCVSLSMSWSVELCVFVPKWRDIKCMPT